MMDDALVLACEKCQSINAGILIEAGALYTSKLGNKALTLVAQSGQLNAVKILLKGPTTVNVNTTDGNV